MPRIEGGQGVDGEVVERADVGGDNGGAEDWGAACGLGDVGAARIDYSAD